MCAFRVIYNMEDVLKTQTGIIYKITNLVDGKSYIGQTNRTFYQRYRIKWWNRISNEYLTRAVKKYGVESFKIEILEHALNQRQLNKKEIYYIDKFKTLCPNGYNFHTGGLNHKTSEKLRKKMSKTQRKRLEKKYVLIKDGKEYRFKNQTSFAVKHNLKTSTLSMLIRGVFRCYKGFHLPETDVRFKRKTDKVRYLVDANGKTHEVCNIFRFAKQHGLNHDCLSKLFSGKIRIHKGFHIVNLPPLPERKKQIFDVKYSSIVLVKGDEYLTIPRENRLNFAKTIGIDLYALLSGKRLMSRGWKIYKIEK